MAEEQIGYGFGDDSGNSFSSLKFGGNFGTARLTKFEYTATGGKDGAPQEAFDIVFTVGTREIGFRQFPVSKIFHEGVEIDNKHPNFKENLIKALGDFNGVVTHIAKAFIDENILSAALAKKTPNFKAYVDTIVGLMPKNFQEKPLDIFLQWQWQITGSNDKTYLTIPKKVSYGKFLVPAVTPVGKWNEQLVPGTSLSYVDDAGNKHPFERGDWFMNSNFAKQQKENEEVPAAVNMETTPQASSEGSSTGGW